jgi:hypothetical protein
MILSGLSNDDINSRISEFRQELVELFDEQESLIVELLADKEDPQEALESILELFS